MEIAALYAKSGASPEEAVRQRAVARIKSGLLIYFLLLIFEGGLRKWILPGLATPLLVVRDPLALWVLALAWRHNLFPNSYHTMLMLVIAVISIYTAVFLGHGSLVVALFGARIFLLHFPLIFLMGHLLNRSDVLQYGKLLLVFSIPVTVLVAIQFYSPQSAWVNRGVGGDVNGSGFAGVGEYLRPAGTFSFTNGTALFYSMVAAYLIYFWFEGKWCNKWILYGATFCLLAAIPLSISRGLFFAVSVSICFALLIALFRPQELGKTILIGAAVAVFLFVLSNFGFFKIAADAFLMRFEMANEQEGGLNSVLVDRYLGGLWGALEQSGSLPFWGMGVGMGTNVGSMALYGNKMFLISEGEWGRVVGELGPLMGLAVIFLRLGLCVNLVTSSYSSLKRGDMLPWMLLSFGLLNIPQGNWAQPTSLGFCIVGGGLLLAAVKSAGNSEAIATNDNSKCD